MLVAVALSIFVGSGDLCGYAWSRRPASPSPLHVALARGVCASGLCGSRTGPRGADMVSECTSYVAFTHAGIYQHRL